VAEAELTSSWAARSPQAVDWTRLLAELAGRPAVSVVVPVFNGGPAVERCLAALVRHTSARLLVIDDASTDQAIASLLDTYAADGRIALRRHEHNMGYTRTVNEGIDLAGSDDVVLLNSDTEVGPLWLERLTWVAYSDENVGTVSAVSDNAGAMAIPVVAEANEWPAHLTWAEISRVVGRGRTVWDQVVPTAHGFCMFIRRACIDAIGSFDAAGFPQGYGEENDLSLRASAAGWSNRVAPHVMVKHARGQSFGSRRAELIKQGRAVVDRRFPEYTGAVRSWLKDPQTAAWRDASAQLLGEARAASAVNPRLLYVIHRSGGGTPATNLDLMRQVLDQDSYLLEAVASREIVLSEFVNGSLRRIRSWRPLSPFTVEDYWDEEYAAFLTNALVELGIERIHIRHLIQQPLGTVSEVAHALGIPTVLSTHDFYMVCPSPVLLDEQLEYCGGVCTPGHGRCFLDGEFLQSAPVNLKHEWIGEWQVRSRRVLELAESVVATTPSAAEILKATYPEIEGKLAVIEHGRDAAEYSDRRAEGSRHPGPLRIMTTAQWGEHKGMRLLRDVAERAGLGVEWHILGLRSDDLFDVGASHGAYIRDDFAALVREIDPDVTALFSIWPETYSHTLTESWALGIPVLATDLGAFHDRVTAYGGGMLFDHRDPARAAAVLRELLVAPDHARSLFAPIAPAAFRSDISMAADYMDQLYRSPSDLPVVGVVAVPGTASSYIRTGRWRTNAHHDNLAILRTVAPRDLLSGSDTAEYDAILVQRTALDPELAPELVAWARKHGTRLVVDLDDDFVTPAARSHLLTAGYSAEVLDAVSTLLDGADTVLLSTVALQHEVVKARGELPITLWPNRLDPRLWSSAVATIAPPKSRHLLYMGTKTHERDLEMLAEPLELASEALGRKVMLDIVGVSSAPLPSELMVRRDVPSSSYPEFVTWLRRNAPRWSAGVAPLAHDALNASKSDLKLLEYAALGVPAIASAFGPYRDRDDLAVLVDNSAQAWSAAIVDALSHPDAARLRHTVAADAVRERHMLDPNSLARWVDVIVGRATSLSN